MKRIRLFSDTKFFARQAIWAWIIMLLSIVIFVSVSLLVSLLIEDRDTIILIAFMLTAPIVTIAHIFARNREYYFAVSMGEKRRLDILLSLFLLLLLAPLLIIIALLIRLDSDGPIMVVSKKASDNKISSYYRFRTMHISAKRARPHGTGDPRITRVGAFLRRYDLHLLPVLFNVLRGDVSFFATRTVDTTLSEDIKHKPQITYGEARRWVRSQEAAAISSR